jgi:HTH-type transcriptional regulator/antitoxin MqsA
MVSVMTASGERCPICGEGHLSEMTGSNPVEYGGRTAELPLLYSVCDVCGSEQAGAAQTRANKRAMIAFRKQVDGQLTGIEVRALRERLGLNQAQAAQIFGGGRSAGSVGLSGRACGSRTHRSLRGGGRLAARR